MRLAVEETGLSDFGDLWFTPHLRKLIDALITEGHLKADGLEIMRRRFVAFLATRLRLQEQLKRHPEILSERIAAPIIIIGLPRTGTTKLQRMMAASGDFSYLPLWQALDPISTDQSSASERASRTDAGRKYVAMLKEHAPEVMAVHEMDADEPEEEIMLMQHSFLTKVVYAEAHIPTFLDWVDRADCRPVYRELSEWLRYIQWQNGGRRKRWLLKCVYHNEFLEQLLEVFPDARLVQLHRDPAKVIGSWCGLVEVFRKVYRDDNNPWEIGPDTLQYWKTIMDRNLDIRRRRPEITVKDFLFTDVVADIDKVITAIYAFADIPLTSEACSRMTRWATANQQYKHGRYDYSLEKFGLDSATVYSSFSTYRDLYKV